MTATIEGTVATGTGVGTAYTIPTPGSIQSGERLVAYISYDRGVIATEPDGWTLVRHPTNSGISGVFLHAPHDVSDFTGVGDANRAWAIACFRVANFDTSTFIDDHDMNNFGNSTSHDAPANVTTVDDCLILYCCAGDADAAPVTIPNDDVVLVLKFKHRLVIRESEILVLLIQNKQQWLQWQFVLLLGALNLRV